MIGSIIMFSLLASAAGFCWAALNILAAANTPIPSQAQGYSAMVGAAVCVGGLVLAEGAVLAALFL